MWWFLFGHRRSLRSLLVILITIYVCNSPVLAQPAPRLVHVFVALADNKYQGIVPVPAALGNGDDPAHNLYWGAGFGVRTFFRKSSDWKEVSNTEGPTQYVLERTIFFHSTTSTYLIADAYRGRYIKQAILDFYDSASGQPGTEIEIKPNGHGSSVRLPRTAALSVYVGHDGLMDFSIDRKFSSADKELREVIILACASKAFFGPALRTTGSQPILWTTGLMAPEAYTLKAALEGWVRGESSEQVRQRAASAYSQYQKCSMIAAQRLFSSTW